MIYIGIDDTDTLETRGTGHLAREIAAALRVDCMVVGVTRHQLSDDPRVPRTHKNSCAAILLDGDGSVAAVTEQVKVLMLAQFVEGSDPGLCVATAVPHVIIDFGHRAQRELVTQAEARALAAAHNLTLLGLGGDEDGVIGALSAVGLAAGGSDGRYIEVAQIRELTGLQPVSALLAAGITAVQTIDGQPVEDGLVQTDKLRPARRNGRPVAVVEWQDDHWLPLKLD
ncbi:MAG: ABC transporter substrate-binding protein [Ardenticatenaceae bacterium]|nr:ABC transporter substrate-binding protein [Ardenticatenaceae bacterium]